MSIAVLKVFEAWFKMEVIWRKDEIRPLFKLYSGCVVLSANRLIRMKPRQRKRVYKTSCKPFEFDGVADGARTHDNRNHNSTLQPSIHAGLRGFHGNKYPDLPLISPWFWGFYSHGKLSGNWRQIKRSTSFCRFTAPYPHLRPHCKSNQSRLKRRRWLSPLELSLDGYGSTSDSGTKRTVDGMPLATWNKRKQP